MLLSQEYNPQWSTLNKLLFRFVFSYFALYILFTFLSVLFQTPFRWVGDTILGISYKYDVSGYGSGDNTYAYITLFVNTSLSVIIAILWSILDRHRTSYNKFFYWFLVVVRIYLVFFMLTYGFVKIFKTQFPSPSLTRLLQPLSDFSPMGLAWTYMGFSKGFNLFTGGLEVFAGLLLIPRRTHTLGGLLVTGVMGHIAMMNFMYDIPVKLFSVHLVLMGLLLFSTDIKRFINIFFRNKPTQAYQFYHPVKEVFYHKFIFWFKAILIIGLVWLFSSQGIKNEKKWGDKRETPYLYGIWEATHFIKNQDTLAPLITDTERWRYLIIERKKRARVNTMNDLKHNYVFLADSISKTISMFKKDSDSLSNNFKFYYPNKEFLQLKGTLENDTLDIIFKRIDHTQFQLNSRGFNWINERPFNR